MPIEELQKMNPSAYFSQIQHSYLSSVHTYHWAAPTINCLWPIARCKTSLCLSVMGNKTLWLLNFLFLMMVCRLMPSWKLTDIWLPGRSCSSSDWSSTCLRWFTYSLGFAWTRVLIFSITLSLIPLLRHKWIERKLTARLRQAATSNSRFSVKPIPCKFTWISQGFLLRNMISAFIMGYVSGASSLLKIALWDKLKYWSFLLWWRNFSKNDGQNFYWNADHVRSSSVNFVLLFK